MEPSRITEAAGFRPDHGQIAAVLPPARPTAGLPDRRVISLRSCLPHASYVGCADLRIAEATDDSREVTPGALFAVVHGSRENGESYVDIAVARGAAALLVKCPLPGIALPQVVVPNVRGAYSLVCSAIEGCPSFRVQLAGVTGTNGKTTVTWMVRHLLRSAGEHCGLLGTVEYSDGVVAEASRLTTPDAKTCARWLGRMLAQRTRFAAVELSSHALDQSRIAGTRFCSVAVTNVTQDHLDYHGTFESYWEAKARIFEYLLPGGLAVLNADDPGSRRMADRLSQGQRLEWISQTPADTPGAGFCWRGLIREESVHGTLFDLVHPQGTMRCFLPLIGRHNVSNALVAVAMCHQWGFPVEVLVEGLETFSGVPGRLEPLRSGQPFQILIDYAHTPDALSRSLSSVQRLTSGRVILVFGAGGDRDRLKRPLMGAAAAAADLVVVTSDNPRSESPDGIIDEIVAGVTSSARHVHRERDRRQAIAWACSQAMPGDTVLIAGKGHETTQTIGREELSFDDRQVAREVLAKQLDRGLAPLVGEPRALAG